MNTKTTMVLALVCAAVFAYLLLVVKPWEPQVEPEKPSADGTPLLDPKPEGIDRIELARGDGEAFVFTRAGEDEWNLEAPIQAPASRFEVDALRDTVTGIHYVKEYAKGSSSRPNDEVTGLGDPTATVKILAGDEVVLDVRIGDRVPTGTGNYLHMAGSDTIYVSKKDLKAQLNKRLDNYRNKRVMQFDLNHVRHVKVEGMRNFELVRNEDKSWVLEAPLRGRADKAKAEAVAQALSNLYVESFKDDKPISDKPYGLDSPQLKVTVQTEQEIPPKAKPGDPDTQPADTQPSMESKTYVLLVGGATDTKGETFFARIGTAPWVFSIRSDTYKNLTPTPAELRDKTIAKVDTARVKKIAAHTPGGVMTLTKESGGKWLFEDETEADGALVNDLIKAVRDLRANEFVTDSKTSLVPLDWDHPRARVELTLEGEVNPVAVLVGPASTSGRMVYVRNAAEEGMATVHEDAVAQLIQPPVSYRDRRVMELKQDRVTQIEINRKGSPSVRLAKKNNQWLLTEPVQAEAGREAVRNLLRDLSSLSAKRVAGTGDKSRFGLDDPQVTLAVWLEPVAALPDAKVVGEKKETFSKLATPQPAATQPAVETGEDVEREIEAIKQMLEFQKTNPQAKPEVTQMLKDRLAKKKAATQPAATKPAAESGADIDRDIKVLEQMLEYQKQHPDTENPLATEMVKDLLAQKKAATQSAAAKPATEPGTDIARDIKVLEQLLESQKTNPQAKPEVTQMLKDRLAQKKAATQPVAAKPAAESGTDIEREIKALEQLLEFQKTNPQAKPEVTQMLKDRLAQKKATTQPAGTPPTEEVSPTSAPKASPTVVRLYLTQKGGKTYAAVAGGVMVYELDDKIFEDATAEMHDRQITRFAIDEVAELAFKTAAARITLRKAGDDWKYVEDPVVPIDKQKVTDVCNAFREIQTHRYVDYDADDLAKYGLAGDADRLAVTLSDRRRIEILLSATGPADDPDKSRYALVAGTRKVFLLKGEQADKFQQKLEDFEKTPGSSAEQPVTNMPGVRPGMSMPGARR